jgi:beta-galactosidase
MSNRSFFRNFVFFQLLVLVALCSPSVAQRTRYNFNSDWRVKVGDVAGAETVDFDDSGWKRVTTPYAWNEDAAFRVSIHDLPTGVAWYRKHFRLPESATGQKIFVEFEGIRMAGEVYVNGVFVGRHEDGVMAFGFDLSKLLRPAPAWNVIAVRTDNDWKYKEKATESGYHWNDSNFYANYGGISKSVWLHVTPQIYQTLPLFRNLGTTGVYVWADAFDLPKHTARVHVESQVRNDTSTTTSVKLNVSVFDLDGKVVVHFVGQNEARISPGETRVLAADDLMNGLHLWSWGYGYLYKIVTTLFVDGKPTDSVTTRTGFRQTEFKNGMVYLNGRVIQIHGYGQRTTNEWPAIGLSVPAWMSDFSNKLMVESNGNLVRWMHVVPWKQDVESSDRVGLLESMPAGDSEGDSKGRQWEQRVELMRDAIIYNRNNPSILFYESGNKGITEEHMIEMKRVRDEYDPHGGRAIGAREMLASHTAEYGGEMLYINKSATKPLWAHEYNRDEGARKFWDNDTAPFHKDSLLYNRNQDSFTLEDVARWDDYYEERPGTGTRVSSGGVNIIWSDSNTHYRGDNNYRRSGEVDAMRIPKDAFYAHQVMWDGWVDVEHPRVHMVGHWNYDVGTVKPVYVVSSAEKVELKLNGRSLGFGTRSERFLFTFANVRWESGELEAIAYDSTGKVVARDVLETAGPPAALKLTVHTGPKGLQADGQDMALVDVEVVDAKGRRCPTALNMIYFKLDGAAEWRGGIAQGSAAPAPRNDVPSDNHGLAQTPPTPLLHEDNYILSTNLPVEGGVNRVALLSLAKAGEITLTAVAEGFAPVKVKLASHAVVVTDGLSVDFPSDDLPVNLERGPTPATPSFTLHRFPIQIASVTAGANASDAAKSFDDDETTSWSNAVHDSVTDGLQPTRGSLPHPTGTLETAWIEYTFARLETVGEVELKLNGFRQRRYPLRITLDGKTVWEGMTPTSLGYCDLKFDSAASGTKLRIALDGPPVDTGPKTIEVNGKVDAAGNEPLGEPTKPVLSVIEAEMYRAGKR